MHMQWPKSVPHKTFGYSIDVHGKKETKQKTKRKYGEPRERNEFNCNYFAKATVAGDREWKSGSGADKKKRKRKKELMI